MSKYVELSLCEGAKFSGIVYKNTVSGKDPILTFGENKRKLNNLGFIISNFTMDSVDVYAVIYDVSKISNVIKDKRAHPKIISFIRNEILEKIIK